jgi:hypothetical protein
MSHFSEKVSVESELLDFMGFRQPSPTGGLTSLTVDRSRSMQQGFLRSLVGGGTQIGAPPASGMSAAKTWLCSARVKLSKARRAFSDVCKPAYQGSWVAWAGIMASWGLPAVLLMVPAMALRTVVKMLQGLRSWLAAGGRESTMRRVDRDVL